MVEPHCSECCPNKKHEKPTHQWIKKAIETTITILTTTGVVFILKALHVL